MKKQTLVRSLLILLPVLAVGLATTVDSVMVYDSVAGTTVYYSYFDPIPGSDLQMLPPLAATLAVISGILAAIFLGKKRTGVLKASGIVAFASAAAASIPMMIRGETLVIPNVGLIVLMLAHFLVARYVEKQPAETKAKKAPKLKAKR